MNFFPENRKKTIIYMVVLLVAISGIVYFNWFADSNLAPLNTPNSNPTLVTPPPAGNNRSEDQVPSVKPKRGLLPFGSNVDTSLLNNAVFKTLRSAPQLEVAPEELGRKDLFVPSSPK